MTLEEFKERVRALEGAIAQEIIAFERETGITPTVVDVNFVSMGTNMNPRATALGSVVVVAAP